MSFDLLRTAQRVEKAGMYGRLTLPAGLLAEITWGAGRACLPTRVFDVRIST
ncbi:MAG: hypothetical protein P4L92_17055 [Rudaea sp.]|nr:hypothetical protein [Rudaea sp.]